MSGWDQLNDIEPPRTAKPERLGYGLPVWLLVSIGLAMITLAVLGVVDMDDTRSVDPTVEVVP